MKPIGLVTCYFHHNYGSMLQAYATEMIFQKMNLPYQTISCKSPIVYMQGNKLLYIIKKILDRKSTRLNSIHPVRSRMPSPA